MFAILLVVFIDLIGFGIIIPLLPFYAETFNASPQKVTMLMVVYSFSQFIFAPVWGGLSDKYGRRVIIWCTLIGTVAAYVLLAFANSLSDLFIARAFAGIMAGNIAVAQAYITDITEKQDRAKAMGLFGAAFGLGFIIGPAIGGILAGSDPNNPSVFLPPIVAAVLSFIALIVALISLKETNLSVNGFEKKRLKSLISALEFPNLRQLILLSFCITVVFALMESTISLWSERTLFWGAQQNGYLFAFAGICGALVQGIFIGPLVKRFGEPFLCFWGCLVLSFGMLGISISTEIIHTVLSMLLIAVGLGLFMPTVTTLIVNMVPEDKKGWVLGITQSVSSLARIIGPALAGVFFEFIGKNSPYLIGGLFLLLMISILKKYIFKSK